MPNGDDNDLYELRITYRVKIKKWRIDDQTIKSNRDWCLSVYDRNLKQWKTAGKLDRPGEETYIESFEVL